MKHTFALLFLLLPFMLQAQTIKLEGKVLAKESGQELPYVNIGIRNKNVGTTSNEAGKFVLSLLEERREDTLTFSAIGYVELSVPVRQLALTKPLELKLQEK